MEVEKVKYLIVGAGLSGLSLASILCENGEESFKILEARSRAGGRILTKEGIDLGATWFQDQHVYIQELLNKCGINFHEQYSKGKHILVYNSMAPPHFFENDPNSPRAMRIAGGSVALIDSISKPIMANIEFQSPVTSIVKTENILEVKTNRRIYHANKVILCLPPKLAEQIEFTPALPNYLREVMRNTHTWMSNAIKLGITYPKAFWKEQGLSGTILGQKGPVMELYDHSNASGNQYSLMGFVNEALRDKTPANRKELILTYLEKYLGPEARNYTRYEEKDWANEEFTSGSQLKSVYMSPQYGNAVFEEAYFNDSLYFSGTETSPVHGGYLEGAIYSSLKTVHKILAEASKTALWIIIYFSLNYAYYIG